MAIPSLHSKASVSMTTKWLPFPWKMMHSYRCIPIPENTHTPVLAKPDWVSCDYIFVAQAVLSAADTVMSDNVTQASNCLLGKLQFVLGQNRSQA